MAIHRYSQNTEENTEVAKMTFADTSAGTIGTLFFSQFRQMTLATANAARRGRAYSDELGKILDAYAPESSRLYRQRRQRFAVYR